MSEETSYPLGYSDEEARRLRWQASLLEEPTDEVLRRAGLQSGMRVLDLGSGLGDVSILAAKTVGTHGAVLGIDRAQSSVDAARERASAAGLSNVRFEVGPLETFTPTQTFDAIIGRLVLLYLRDSSAVLQRLSQYLRPGGIVAFVEYDIPPVSQVPPSELFLKTRHWVLAALAAGGAELEMGTKLYRTFLHAGLPAPRMTAYTPVSTGNDESGYEYLVAVLRSLLPLVERSGIAKPEEIQIDTLAARLHADASVHERVAFLPRIVGAWARRPD